MRILITGGTSGLGAALAARLRANGASVLTLGRGKTGPSPPDILADVSSKDDVYRVAALAVDRLGGVDALVNAASTLGPTPLRALADTGCEDLEAALATNVVGPFRLAKALLPPMLLQGRGLILNVSSDAAVSAYPRWGAYGSSKAALDQLSRVWDAELRDRGVRVLSIDPGDMDTPMHRAAVPDADPATLGDPADAAARFARVIEETLA